MCSSTGNAIPLESRRIFREGWCYHIFDGKVYHNTISSEAVPGTHSVRRICPFFTESLNELLVHLVTVDTPRFKSVVHKVVPLDIDHR